MESLKKIPKVVNKIHHAPHLQADRTKSRASGKSDKSKHRCGKFQGDRIVNHEKDTIFLNSLHKSYSPRRPHFFIGLWCKTKDIEITVSYNKAGVISMIECGPFQV